MIQTSIVTVTWNAKDHVEAYLNSLASHLKNPQMQAIVVDNASSDGTPQVVRENYPNVTLVENKTNCGFAKANNRGIGLSKGKYIFLINSDVKVLDGCIEKMITHMESHPTIGLLGPRMVGITDTSCRSFMGEPSLWRLFCRALALDSIFPNSKMFGGFMMTYFDRDKTADVDVLNGWFWMVRAEALVQTGLLDESFFIYGEDIDWCKRFHKAGWRVVYYPEARAIHYGGASSSVAPVRFYIERQRANLQYWKKYHGKTSQKMYLLVTCLDQIVRIIGYSLVYLFNLSDRSRATHKIRMSTACIRWAMGLG